MKRKMRWRIIPGLLVLLLLFAIGCSDDDDGVDTVIRFTVNGTNYSYTQGFADLSRPAEVCLDNSQITPVYTLLAATPSGADSTNEYAMICIYLERSVNEWEGSIGEYEDTIVFQAKDGDTVFNDDITITNFSVTIEQNDKTVGGIVSGTFSGSLTGGLELTDGYFKTVRVQTNTLQQSDGYSGMPNPLP